ncbi:MAG TPA: hypothetical protein VGS07_15305 [Thermoanaerobaculia bacterium]|nr:hypothetical protein [Thermoanaerobaculia bacterium]
MTLSIEIPEELKTELVTEAEHLGLSLSDYTLQLLRLRRPAGDLPRTGTDLVTYWRRENLIGTRPEIADSPAHARRLREQAERRRGA